MTSLRKRRWRTLGKLKEKTKHMQMNKGVMLACLLACVSIGTKAQDKSVEPKGKAIIQVFGNFNTGFGAQNDVRGFELERSYLGYEYNLGNGLTIKSVMDMGKSSDVSDNQRIAYVKNAMITWKKEKFTLNGGLIPTTQFNFQEKLWGYRYIMKDFQDLYKFGHSADLGISVAYKFNKIVSVDAVILNGEGFKKLQKNDGLNYGAGITITPIEGLSIRLYAGINEGADKSQKDIVNFAAFAGYKGKNFTIGAEYNKMNNGSYKQGADQEGYSIYTTVKVSSKTDLFGRYDNLCSKDNWNISKDEQAAIAGAQFKLGKYVKLAPNFRVNIPKADDADNKYAAYLSFYFGL